MIDFRNLYIAVQGFPRPEFEYEKPMRRPQLFVYCSKIRKPSCALDTIYATPDAAVADGWARKCNKSLETAGRRRGNYGMLGNGYIWRVVTVAEFLRELWAAVKTEPDFEIGRKSWNRAVKELEQRARQDGEVIDLCRWPHPLPLSFHADYC